jgi:hypothetical protein
MDFVAKIQSLLSRALYTLQTESSRRTGLPVITSSMRIQTSVDNLSTVIVRDPAAGSFRIFTITLNGRLNLIGITVQRGLQDLSGRGAAIPATPHLRIAGIIESRGERGAVNNTGTLEILNG